MLTPILRRWAFRLMARRAPDFIIGGADDPYLKRWWVIPRNKYFNVYLHNFKRSDDDRALHDHPWWNMSWLLDGQYLEHTISDGGVHYKKLFTAGAKKFRSAKYAHRVELIDQQPCVSLFITGPKIREWYFHCTKGLVIWTDFVKDGQKGEIGKGCGD